VSGLQKKITDIGKTMFLYVVNRYTGLQKKITWSWQQTSSDML